MQLEGHIAEIDVVERLVELWRERFTGAFRFEQDGVIKIIYFKSGDVLSASTNDRTDAIDEILLRAGKVNREHIKQALAKRKESETLGDALLNLGFITRKELTWARRVQVIGILRSIRGWAEGTYTGVADYLPKREEGTLFALPQVILELIVTDSERPHFEQAMDGGAAVFAKTATFDETYTKLGLNEEADDIVDQIDGGRSASEIAAASGADAFNAYKLLEALRVLGMIDKVAAHPGGGLSLDDFAAAGVGDATEAWAAPGNELDFDSPSPTLELPATAAPASEPEWATEPQWEAEAETPSFADVPVVAPMEATEKIAAYEPPAPTLTPPPLPPPPIAQEPQWGFDEAQIETARRAAVPLRSREQATPPPAKEVVAKASKPGRVAVMVLTLVALVIVGFGGWAAWWWWQQRNQPAPAVAVTRPAKHPRVAQASQPAPPPPVTTTTAAAVSTATTATTATTTTTATPATVPPPAPVKTTSVAPAPAHLERTASGAATITNTTASAAARPVAASSDAARAKYDAMAREQAANHEGTYTVQFEMVCETASVTRALQDGGSSVWFLAAPYKGRSCYRVFWGRYGTAAEAERAIVQIPAALREGSKAAVVKIPR